MKYDKTIETVNHPSHYNQGIEVLDFIESHEMCFSRGNIVKYVVRAAWKGCELEDLEKAKFYLEREIQRIKDGDNKVG